MNWIKEELKKIKIDNKKIKNFGIVFFVFFNLFSIIKYYNTKNFPFILSFIGVIFLFLALITPKILKPVYKLWMIFGILMNFIMTKFILIILYYFIITPINIFLKIINKNILDEKIEKEKVSYWKDHNAVISKTQYLKQF